MPSHSFQIGDVVALRPREELDDWHRRRFDKHGWLYKITRLSDRGHIATCTSVATGQTGVTFSYAGLIPLPQGD